MWTGRRLPKGYPVTGKKSRVVTREIVAERDGLDYDDKSWETRHLCGNEPCVEPSHLVSGDQRENELDSPVTGASKYRGVGRNYAGWMARIRAGNGKRIYLGTFPTEEEAHAAYQRAALDIYGVRTRE